MKEIVISGGVFISGVTLKRTFKRIVDVYAYGKYVGVIDIKESRLKYTFTTAGTKYYTIEKRL